MYPKFGTPTLAVVSGHGLVRASGITASGGLNTASGDSIYVFIAYDAGSAGANSVQLVTDSTNVPYKRAAIKQNIGHTGATNPAVEIWYLDNVPASSTVQVTVTFISPCVFVFYAANIKGAANSGSFDMASAGDAANGNNSTDPIASVSPDDLILACQCSVHGTGGTPTSGGGFLPPAGVSEQSSGTNGTYDIFIDLLADGPSSPNDFNSSLSWPNNVNFATVTIGVRAPIELGGVVARPFITVSPSLTPDGSDYGPWSAVTGPNGPTWGIQEALSAAAQNPNGGTVVLRTSLGPFIPTTANPMSGFFIPPKVDLTTDRPHMKKATSTFGDTDIEINSHFMPIDAFLYGKNGAGGVQGSYPTVIATASWNPNTMTNGSYNALQGSGGIRHLCITFESTAPACDGIHLTNWDHGTIEDVIVNGATGTSPPGPITNPNYPGGSSGSGYSSGAGIALDFYGTLPESSSVVPGQYFGGDIICIGGASVGLFIGGVTQVFLKGVELLMNAGDGCYLLNSTSVQIVNFISQHGNNNGLSLVDDGTAQVSGNSISNVYFKNNGGVDIFAYGTYQYSTGNTVDNGVSASTYGYFVTALSDKYPMVSIANVLGITNLGILPTNGNSGPPLSSLSSGVALMAPASPAAGALLTIVGGVGSAILIQNAAGNTSFSLVLSPSGSLAGTYQIPPGGKITITFATAPTSWTWKWYVMSVGATSPASGTAYFNFYPFTVNAYIYGGTVTAVTKDSSTATAVSPATIGLSPGNAIKITWMTTGPTMTWDAVW
jgi:hypothetical protein